MASLESRYDARYRIVFCWQGKRRYHSLGRMPEREARSCLDRLEESLRFVERGLLDVPPDAELGPFLVSGGRLNARPRPGRPAHAGRAAPPLPGRAYGGRGGVEHPLHRVHPHRPPPPDHRVEDRRANDHDRDAPGLRQRPVEGEGSGRQDRLPRHDPEGARHPSRASGTAGRVRSDW
jgi:hypothetical protein